MAFKREVATRERKIDIIGVPISPRINYDWTWENLDRGIDDGYQATDDMIASYRSRQLREHPVRDLRRRAARVLPDLHFPFGGPRPRLA